MIGSVHDQREDRIAGLDIDYSLVNTSPRAAFIRVTTALDRRQRQICNVNSPDAG